MQNEDFEMQISYQVKANYPALEIQDDSTLLFYIQLKSTESDQTKFPLSIKLKKRENNNIFFTSTPAAAISQSQQQSTSTNNMESISDIIDVASQIEKNDGIQSPLINHSIISSTTVKEIEANQIFNSKHTLKTVVKFYAISKNFQFRVIRSCPRKYYIDCIDDNCSWNLKASQFRNTSMFQIRQLSKEHTCNLEARMGSHRHATKNLIADCIKSKYTSVKTVYTPTDIIRDMQVEYGISVNYMKAWRSRDIALEHIRGKPDESFSFLPSFLYMVQQTNPGSMVELKTTDDGRFLYVYMALYASINGWKHCMPVIVVDGTFLKLKFRGTLISATTQDASRKIFPLAFVIVDSENDASWEWFFVQVKKTFGVRDKLSIVSDRHESIISAVKEVYPEAAHAFCIFHIINNIKTKFKRNTLQIKELFLAAAKATK